MSSGYHRMGMNFPEKKGMWDNRLMPPMVSMLAAPVQAREIPAPPPVLDVVDTKLTTLSAKSIARQSGFTGDQCDHCGSMRVVNTGTCKTCQDCATTSGCA